MVMEKANIKLVSDMDDETVRQIFMEPYDDLQSAVEDAFAEQREHIGGEPSVIIMPYGGSTLPIVD